MIVVNSYYFRATGVSINPDTAKITILQQPKHGTLEMNPDWVHVIYLPNDGYLGNDSVVLQVAGDGHKVELRYFLTVTDKVGDTENTNPICNLRTFWKISQDANGNSVLTAVEYPSPVSEASSTITDPTSMSALLGSGLFDTSATSGITLNVADLAGGAVGQTTGTSITLDINAANNGWFIDSTPNLNEEWLPTSNPNEWVAKAGSAAYGKMDMLSVLLHEYGHALGIEHSADQYDFMGTTLTAGIRRMPSAEELALMQQLNSI